MTKPRVAILDDYYSRAAAFAAWDQAGFAEFVFFDTPMRGERSVIDALRGFAAVGLMRERTPFPASVIEQLPDLKLIITSGKKNASIDVAAANRCGITVCGTESPGHATAELALLLVMALQRQLVPLSNALQQDGLWQPLMGRDCKGRTLGILGLGRLGSQLAGFAKALGMQVIAWSENLDPERCASLSVEYVSREELFTRADTVSVHLRHSQRTHHMIDQQDLQRLGRQGYLVNTSRAEIVDPTALRQALDDHTIAGVATDVFYDEPADLSDWLVSHPKVLATPHIGYCTEETFKVFYQQMLDGFEAYFNGTPVRVISA